MERLIKMAVNPDDLSHVDPYAERMGPSFVDHTGYLNSHPSQENEDHADDYLANIITTPDQVNKLNETLGGVSAKTIFRSPKTRQKYLVKHFHEAVQKGVLKYTRFPIMGWSEMATQALYHAGKVGDLTQKVHVTEHDTPKYKKLPMLVVALDQNRKYPVDDLQYRRNAPSTSIFRQGAIIGLMDYLTNQQDRHQDNLLYGTNDDGSSVSGLLAIDNSRAFQYKIPNRWQQFDIHTDHPMFYLSDSPAMAQLTHDTEPDVSVASSEHLGSALKWWLQLGPKVRKAFVRQLDHIPNPALKNWLGENFFLRADILDKFAKEWQNAPDSNEFDPQYGGTKAALLRTPTLIFRPRR